MRYRSIKVRRRSALTNYKRRIALLKGGAARVVVRRSNRGVTMQLVGYKPDGDVVLASAKSVELKKFEWQPRANLPTAYLTGMLLAKKAQAAGTSESVLDIGLYKPVKSALVFAAAKGAADGGIKLLNGIEVDVGRVSGKHIAEYAKALAQKDAGAYKRQFGAYAKAGLDPQKLPEMFEAAKKRIKG